MLYKNIVSIKKNSLLVLAISLGGLHRFRYSSHLKHSQNCTVQGGVLVISPYIFSY